MRSPLLLLLKLSAAAAAGTAALLSFRRLLRSQLISSLRLDIRDSLNCLASAADSGAAGATPPSILITGFRSHGKSSLVNTLLRALSAESGPFLLRAETAPPGATPATLERHVIRADVAGEREGDEAAEVEIVDGTALPETEGKASRADVQASLMGPNGGGVECVVVVVRCGAPPKERQSSVRRLGDVAAVVRERGLHLVVVLTQKKALKTTKQAEDLRREVAFRARTDCVYFIENYTAANAINVRRPVVIKNDFEAHLTALTIIRQCIEFVKMYRSHSLRKANVLIPATKSALVKEQ
ncbi:uncharacterized protein M6B38_140385 [Iris pallida]|uniref:G domain-containing protein n=1 Tax=Iris pallida TaxID=29817 RepID=A0AAX6FCI5_IRIPA|nr:uncharacterized protein M6B38_140385 [Iris pallida]